MPIFWIRHTKSPTPDSAWQIPHPYRTDSCMSLPYRFTVVPSLPESLAPLRELSVNMWWSWQAEARWLFRDIDPKVWEECGHSPVSLLRKVSQKRLEEVSRDGAYLERLHRVRSKFDAYMARRDRWFHQTQPHDTPLQVAYFSAEFGFHESLQNYSGGLGILAGDHCKSASDLGIPLVGIGLMYRQGYFIQRLNSDGWQEAEYINWDFRGLPVTEVRDTTGEPVEVSVQLPGRKVFIHAWLAQVGLTRVYFLTTDIPKNSEADRKITFQLYGGDHEMRIQQEIVLGIGGVRFLRALGIYPTAYHLNEGHAAFLALERIRELHDSHGLKFHEALQPVAASNVFTTHTPVPAGNDAFSPALMHKYFDDFIKPLDIDFDQFLKLGRPWGVDGDTPFSMTILALRLSRFANGVSKIHGAVSRDMWRPVWPMIPVDEIPIGHITNGIHTQTWMANSLLQLVESRAGAIWEDRVADPEAWKVVEHIPNEELWHHHCQMKHHLVEFAREKVRAQRLRNNEPAAAIRATKRLLDPNVLTIGFARRFATYKRATLIFRDLERLSRLVNHPERPIQLVFAGKSHPADEPGKKLIQKIYQISRLPEFEGKVVFIENYDIDVARHLYHGVDIWLNNPTRPLEASGTSGEKVAPNGIVNLSVLDGWWAEAWQRRINGWAIGEVVTSNDPEVQTSFDSESLYTLLENEIAPLFYRRDHHGVPHEWIGWMKNSMMTVSPYYSSFRQVRDYTEKYYRPASERGTLFSREHFAPAKELSAWKDKMRRHWDDVKITDCHISPIPAEGIPVCQGFQVSCRLIAGPVLKASDILVEAYAGSPDGRAEIFPLELGKDGLHHGTIALSESGQYDLNFRATPHHPMLSQKHEMRMITWAV